MQHLKGLSFCVAPKKDKEDPIILKRQKFIEKLELQRQLVMNPAMTTASKKTIKNPDGTNAIVERQKTLKPWWTKDQGGVIVLTLRRGFKLVEFEKGKSGILVEKLEKLDGTLRALIDAVRAGEMDSLLFASKKDIITLKKAS